ncbi:uncharacterized protein A1O9_11657 [Exophiala aquamarina CBS 119918]|uniref:RNase III domain-containing protein n=1 Tax=Exophiala aquamarina CBS 119918 TaxID=1182545 RepID=A0A072NXT6_9EURO|nr:uncharacterized protein A1O9_11657 [Exophiala aquamarina CBS 119918]KEF52416.1 hypothetical protein A1O9_11657 [Exophiala aquamarina CBS 119918]
MADRHPKRPFTGRHDHQAPHKKPRHQSHSTSPFALPAHSVPQVILASDLPVAPEIDEKYSTTVFTHQSVASKDPKSGGTNSYDRLEFLGDAYLEVIASELIFDRFSTLPAGRMSQVRESLIKNETLSRLTEAYGWDKKMKNSQQLHRESAQAWVKIKGDVFEAYVAAVVLSHQNGLQIAKAWLQTLWASALDSVAAQVSAPSHSKQELAMRIAGKGVKINYVDEKPPIVHKGQGVETYFVGVYLDGWGWDNQFLGSGKGLSRSAAGQEAAAAAIKNKPLIDEIMAKRATVLTERKNEQIGASLDS